MNNICSHCSQTTQGVDCLKCGKLFCAMCHCERIRYGSDNEPKIWYVDCYSYGAVLGDQFPVNSYFHWNLDYICKKVVKILANGIDEVKITRKTKGQGPVRLDYLGDGKYENSI